jgi:DNA mismatch repair protein MLH1
MIALDNPEAQYNPKTHLPKEEMVEFYKNKLVDKSDILNEYFSIEIDKESASLVALPIIYEVVKPYPEELPMFMLRLACDIDFSCQNKYFHQISEELSYYYAKLVQLFQIHN